MVSSYYNSSDRNRDVLSKRRSDTVEIHQNCLVFDPISLVPDHKVLRATCTSTDNNRMGSASALVPASRKQSRFRSKWTNSLEINPKAPRIPAAIPALKLPLPMDTNPQIPYRTSETVEASPNPTEIDLDKLLSPRPPLSGRVALNSRGTRKIRRKIKVMGRVEATA